MAETIRSLTVHEKLAAEAAFRGAPFNPAWGARARRVYDGIWPVAQTQAVVSPTALAQTETVDERGAAVVMPGGVSNQSGVWDTLARHPSARIREAASRHPGLPTPLLQDLENDEDPGVRAGLAARPDVSVEWLLRASIDPSAVVRAAAAANPWTPAGAVRRLRQDPSPCVARTARDHPLHDDPWWLALFPGSTIAEGPVHAADSAAALALFARRQRGTPRQVWRMASPPQGEMGTEETR